MFQRFNFFTVIIFLMLYAQITQAQKITLAELHSMSSNKNWETSNKFLLSRGWEYYDSTTGDDEHYNTIIWSFDKSYLDDKKANSWLYIYSYDGLPNKVMYRFRKKEYYSFIKNMLPSNGYKLDDEEILNQKVIAKYSNPNYILELEYLREEDQEDSYSGSASFTVYQITVFKKGGVYDPNNGKKQQFDDDGNLAAEYLLKDGEFNGLATIYNTDGSIKVTKTFNMGKEEGPFVQFFYREDGTLGAKYFGNLKDGKKSGKWYFNILDENAKERSLSDENYVDGVKEGNFREVKDDSLIFCTYKQGLLEGKYKVYTDLNRKLFGFPIQTDTTKITKSSEGQFYANKKVGYWKNYDDFGTLTSEGVYNDSLKSGKWKFYYPKYVQHKSNMVTEYSGKLYLIANYYMGMLNGESVRYSSLESEEIPCEDSTSTEPCYKKVFVEFTEKLNYKNDLLEGTYELVNKNNETLYKGQYSNNKETGLWTIKNASEVDFWRGETTEKGIYQNGEKVGKWERFDNEMNLIESYFYEKSALNGEQITYFDNLPRVKRIFKSGALEKVTLLDSLGKIVKTYHLLEILPYEYKCATKKNIGNTEESFTFKVKLLDDEMIIPTFFIKIFEELPTERKILNGPYEKRMSDKLIEKGEYNNNKRTGVWNYFYYDQNIQLDIDFSLNGDILNEYYYDLKKLEPFTGEFIYKDEIANITEERKIKEGKRNGTTRFKDADDKTIKKESYKDGLLKE